MIIGPPKLDLVPTDPQLAVLRADLESLCRSLAPADVTTPLYILFRHELPEDCIGANVRGLWAPGLDLLARNVLGDRWRGRGVGLLLDAISTSWDGFCMDAQSGAIDSPDSHLVPLLIGITLHELAHELQNRPPRSRSLSPDHPDAAFTAAHALNFLRATPDEWPAESGPQAPRPMAGHGKRWIRAALHLHHRAACLGVKLPRHYIAQTSFYGLSPIGDYAAALGDEPARMVQASFKQIRRQPMPPAFIELWDADLAAWSARSRCPSDAATTRQENSQ